MPDSIPERDLNNESRYESELECTCMGCQHFRDMAIDNSIASARLSGIEATSEERERIKSIFAERRRLLQADIDTLTEVDPAFHMLLARKHEVGTLWAIISREDSRR